MRTRILKEEPPITEDDVKFKAASKQDLELATHLMSITDCGDEEMENVYTDGEFYYYCPELEVEGNSRIGKPKTRKMHVWVRSTIRSTGYSYFEPEEYYEEIVDRDEGFDTLSDAVRKTLLEKYEMELDSKTNVCFNCNRSGFQEDIDGDTPCPKCGGKGWFSKNPTEEKVEKKTLKNMLNSDEDDDYFCGSCGAKNGQDCQEYCA